MVHKFIEVFDILTVEIAHALKRADVIIEEERYGFVNVELIIEHFLQSASKP